MTSPAQPKALATGRTLRSLLPSLVASLLLAGCAEQRIRNESQEALAAGKYEQAIQGLDAGVKRYPDSAVLRSGLIQARASALSQRVSAASDLRAAGKLDEAQAELQSALALDPQNRRLSALLDELQAERRQKAALAEAEALVVQKQPRLALSVVEQALKDGPRHAGLQALQRRLELDQRQALLRSSRAVLAETRPVSLDFRDANLRTVLDAVSRHSGINFILDRDIRADTRVTVYMRQARVEDALDLITSTNQLAKKVLDSQTIVVYPNTVDKQREYQEQIVKVFYLASADAKGAAAFLRAMIKVREPFVDERSNMLAVRESPEVIQLAERLIALYDTGEPEVMLEVEVMEISSTRLTELGVKFPSGFSLTPLAPAGAAGLTLGNVRGLDRDRVGLGVAGLLVNLKREVGDFTTLANPKIRARNKEKAKVMIGDKIPVVTTTTGTGGFVSDSVNYLDVGLKLEVEPTVYADDEVAIKVALEVSTLGTAVKTASGSLAYQIGTRNASTVLRLRDGETQLLAGLISRDDRTNSSRVPGLGDLPILGRLFSSQADDAQRTELVLAITPRILRNIRRPDANETELWVGTEAMPRLQPVGGLRMAARQEPEVAQQAVAGVSAKELAPAVGAAEATKSGGRLLLKWRSPSEAKVGDVLEVPLLMASEVPLRGLPVEIQFDREKLQLLDVTEGGFFRQDGAATSYSKSGDGKSGRITVGVLRNQGTAVGGEGVVLNLRFKAIAAGDAQLSVVSAQPIALNNSEPAPTLPPPAVIKVR